MMESIIGHRIDYNGVGALRGHTQEKLTQVLPPGIFHLTFQSKLFNLSSWFKRLCCEDIALLGQFFGTATDLVFLPIHKNMFNKHVSPTLLRSHLLFSPKGAINNE